MNILFFLSSLKRTGGVERATVALANSLLENTSNKVFIVTLNNNADESAFPLHPNVKVFSLGIGSYKKNFFTLIFRLRRLIKKGKFDILISVESSSLLFTFIPMLGLKSRTKLIVWEHFNFKNNNGRKSREYFRKLASKFADMVVTLTERDVMMWKNNLNMKAEITFAYNVSPLRNDENGYSTTSRKAIAIGRYVPVKGFERLIKIWAVMSRKYDIKDWQLQIIGFGDLKDFYLDLIDKEKCTSIVLCDGSKGTQEYFAGAGVYCMTSFFEGMPMVLIEAQNFGIPCIAYDIYSGPSEILIENSGILIEDNDLEKYVDELYFLIANDERRRSMSNTAFKLSTRFDAAEIVLKWQGIFANVLK